MTRREELLLQKDGFERERRQHADCAHNARLSREDVETELRELEKDEIKALRANVNPDGTIKDAERQAEILRGEA